MVVSGREPGRNPAATRAFRIILNVVRKFDLADVRSGARGLPADRFATAHRRVHAHVAHGNASQVAGGLAP